MNQKHVDGHIETLGKRLRTCIETRKNQNSEKKTMTEQAKDLDIPVGTLSRYLYNTKKGVQMIMGVDKLVKVASYYDKSADYLLGLSEYDKPIRNDGDRLIEEVCQYTGLSLGTIQELHKISSSKQGKRTADMIAALVEIGGNRLFNTLMEYFHSDTTSFCTNLDKATDAMAGIIDMGEYLSDEGNFSKTIGIRNAENLSLTTVGGYVDKSFVDSILLHMIENILQDVRREYRNMNEKITE